MASIFLRTEETMQILFQERYVQERQSMQLRARQNWYQVQECSFTRPYLVVSCQLSVSLLVSG